MNFRYTKFKRIQIIIQDVFYGTSFGLVWSGILGWLIYKYIYPSNLLLRYGLFIGGILGFLFELIASLKFIKTTGGMQEHRKATIEYGKSILYIILTISTFYGIFAGYLKFGYKGILIGALIGFFIFSFFGFIFSTLYFIVFRKFSSKLSTIFDLFGNTFNKLFSIFPIIIDTLFSIFEKISVKFHFTTKEKLTGISEAMECLEKGNKFHEKNKIRQAIKEYIKAIKLDSEYAEAYNNLGYDFGILGKHRKEIWAYKKALEIKPDYLRAMNNLIKSYFKSGNDSEAINWLNKIKELEPRYSNMKIDELIQVFKK